MKLTKQEEAISILGLEEYLSGLGGDSFHFSARKISSLGEVNFSARKYFN